MEYVAYIGQSDVRGISAQDWAEAGIKDQKGIKWDSGNGYKVPVDRLSKDALQLLAQDLDFAFPGGREAPVEG